MQIVTADAGQNIWEILGIKGSAGEKKSTGIRSVTQAKKSLAGK